MHKTVHVKREHCREGMREKTKPGMSRASWDCLASNSVLDVQLGAAVARTAFRIVRTVVVGVRR
ncbi:hypothetical protein, partial [Luteimonas mephitis]|uniref:hypothetical protein n=1 Tax=Luteimonas mephitis TaxID=83615 RepID=UPI003A8E89AD